MDGLMMDYPLTLLNVLERARRLFPQKEIATKLGPEMHRYTYADFSARVKRLAEAMTRLGIRRGDRVATLAWNSYRHLELYFAVPCMGAVLHTLNLRLPPDQLTYIANHAEDRALFADASLAPLVERIAPDLKSVRHFVFMGEGSPPAQLAAAQDYEDLLAAGAGEFDWPRLEENWAAGMCYTSGTTGHPKGVVYSHRSMYLHSLALALSDSCGLSERDAAMPVVPMFHAMAWGFPYTATLVGAKQVFPGPHLQPRDLAELIQTEKITVTAGVPTLWIGLLRLLESERYDISTLRSMVVGGSAVPRAVIEGFQRNFGVPILHAWGMTETSPLGTVARLKSHMQGWPEADRLAVRAKQGIPVPGIELRAIDEKGQEVPWDGQTMGELEVRGPWVTREYYKDPRSADSFSQGWFRTGDVVTIDAEGYIQIVDRTKDLVKSGGEWISTVELENALMASPKVMEAAVIAVPHPKWQERPVALVVPKPEFKLSIAKDEILDLLRQQFPSWYLPDDVVFIEAIPKTSVGKFDKKVLREQFKEHRLGEA
jgi:fatty-acyl-CoA synthase